MTPLVEHLTSINACDRAIAWVGQRTAQEAWDECVTPGWLIWWALKTRVNHWRQVRDVCHIYISDNEYFDSPVSCNRIRKSLICPWHETSDEEEFVRQLALRGADSTWREGNSNG